MESAQSNNENVCTDLKGCFINNTINTLDGQGHLRLLDVMGSEIDIVNAARVSFNKQVNKMEERDFKLLKYLINSDPPHTSPLEMVEFKFEIYCPIQTARQWMRHRTWSYNEISRRYTEEDIVFYFPKRLRVQSKSNRQGGAEELSKEKNKKYQDRVKKLYKDTIELYNDMINDDVALEDARGVLPVNLMTKFIGKVDGNNLVGFVKKRLDKHAQKEIREYARGLVILTMPYIPTVWECLLKKEQFDDINR